MQLSHAPPIGQYPKRAESMGTVSPEYRVVMNHEAARAVSFWA